MAAHRTKSIEERILSALGVERNLGHGPLTATQLHTQPGLTGRLYGEIEAACETMVRGGDLARIEEWTPRGHRVSYCLPLTALWESIDVRTSDAQGRLRRGRRTR